MLLIKIIRGIDPDMNEFFTYANEVTKELDGEDFTKAIRSVYIQHIYELLISPKAYLYVLNKMSRMFGEVDYWFENIYPGKNQDIYFDIKKG